LTIATQHSESNIISGLIKVNFPVRIALHVPSIANSETILDVGGAEQLAEHNDILVSTGVAKPIHVRRAIVDASEIDRVTDFASRQHDCHVEYGLPKE
jgi:S-DNA-T family DNA segregation ATPase FtsK/SpoIIIE